MTHVIQYDGRLSCETHSFRSVRNYEISVLQQEKRIKKSSYTIIKRKIFPNNRFAVYVENNVLWMYLQNKQDHKILTIQDRICSLQGNLLIHSWKCVFWSVNVFILHSFSGLNYSGKKICWGKQIYLQQ